MNFATALTHVETLSYYDRPLLEHWKDTNGQDFLMVWHDENQDFVTWYAVPVSPENLAKFLERDLDKAIDLRQIFFATPTVWRIEANSFVYDVTQGVALAPANIPNDLLPGDGSYCHVETFVAWEARQKAAEADAVHINLIEPVQPSSPGVADTVPGEHLDWPDLDTVPSELGGGDGCPWKQSNFL